MGVGGAPSSSISISISISLFQFHTATLTRRPIPKHFSSKFRLKPPRPSLSVTNMSLPMSNNNNMNNSTNNNKRKVPILLFDIMDTLVRDPFYEDVPAFFGMSLKELIDCKHPTAWAEFEKGLIDEVT